MSLWKKVKTFFVAPLTAPLTSEKPFRTKKAGPFVPPSPQPPLPPSVATTPTEKVSLDMKDEIKDDF